MAMPMQAPRVCLQVSSEELLLSGSLYSQFERPTNY